MGRGAILHLKSSPHHLLCSEGEGAPEICPVIVEEAENLTLGRLQTMPRTAGD